MGSPVTTAPKLKDGGEFVMTANTGGVSSEQKSAYKVDGEKITLTVDGKTRKAQSQTTKLSSLKTA